MAMRPQHALVAVAILAAMSAAIAAGGQRLAKEEPSIVIDEPAVFPDDVDDDAAQDAPADVDSRDLPADTQERQADDAGTADAAPDVVGQNLSTDEPTAGISPPVVQPPGPSRSIDPETISPPRNERQPLERVEPRQPLSDLSLATPPKPPKQSMPDKWKGTPLYQPVATDAGLIQAKGYSVAVSGIDPVRHDETCTDGTGKSWPCGLAARTAFRAFLRGRAVVCKVPPENGRDTIAAECRIGKTDLGQWLVDNGWARALAGGPYAEAADKAKQAAKGVFGKAPSLSGLPQPAPSIGPAPASIQPSPSIIDFSGQDAMPAAPAESGSQVFPPPPPAP